MKALETATQNLCTCNSVAVPTRRQDEPRATK